MIKWESEPFQATVTLDVNSGDEYAEPVEKSELKDVPEFIYSHLSKAHRAFGHGFHSPCTGFDLACAMADKRIVPYAFNLVEGREFIVQPEIPEGSQS